MIERSELEQHDRAAMMHRVRSATASRSFVLDSNVLKLWRGNLRLPSPFEQIENLILWFAGELRSAGQRRDLAFDDLQAVIGAADKFGFAWVLSHAEAQGWIEGRLANFADDTPAKMLNSTLTLAGWQLADELKKSGKTATLAFIAMKFGDAELETMVRDHFSPVVRSTGFELRPLNEGQPAGLIDDQLRVAIRRARFVLVDLTHGNRGAYWEAGFAEGLGKPVIYLCREDVFNSPDPSVRPHFDASHLVTILWNPTSPDVAANRLKACIRATLPDEAAMEDVE
jgi:hypothetical protein